MFRLLQKLILKKFVLFVNDDGALLTFFYKGKPVESIMVNGIQDENILSLSKFLQKHPRTPIYILSDVSEQSLNIIDIPSNNTKVAKKLIRRKIIKDFNKDDLNNYYPIKKTTSTKKDSSYVIANVASIPPLSDWLNYLNDFSNHIQGIYCLPIELKSLSIDLDNYFSPRKTKKPKLKKNKRKTKLQSKWQMTVIQNNIGGIRILVSCDEQVLFTRMLTFDHKNFDQYQVDVLKNQIIGTIEYLRRIGFKEKDGIKIFFICSDHFYQELGIHNTVNYKIVRVLSNDLASIIYNKDIPKNRDGTIEQDISSFFVNKGKYLGFYTNSIRKINKINNINFGLSLVSVFSTIFIAAYIILNIQILSVINKDIVRLELKGSKLIRKLNNIRQEKFGSDLNEDEVIDVATLHNLLTIEQYDPLDVTILLSSVKPKNITISKISWEKVENNISVAVDAMFISKDLSYEDLFIKYDSFIKELKLAFPRYQVEHSELPDTISFDLSLDDIPIEFRIKGKPLLIK